jgi:lysophospholipase L1-like esterase
MYAESCMFVDRDGSSQARLLFPPDEILSVTSAGGGIVYVDGADYIVERSSRRIVRLPGSRMPQVRRDEVGDGALTHRRTVAVTYTHAAGLWTGYTPHGSHASLPRCRARLDQREPLTICLTGDSISEGYDSSGFHGVPPGQAAFGELVAAGLTQQYGAAVNLRNLAVAGWTAADGLSDIGRIAVPNPDLVIIAFGMNDACYAEAGEFAANVSDLLQGVRARVPHAEFVLVSPMLPTPECTWVVADRFGEYRTALADLTGEGVVLADVTTLWRDVVARKDAHDLSGNGLNHPNDFGHRLYAQTLLAVLGCALL